MRNISYLHLIKYLLPLDDALKLCASNNNQKLSSKFANNALFHNF